MRKNHVLLLAVVMLMVQKTHAQTLITAQNFDGVVMPALPSGWTTTTNFGIGWRTDSTNVSGGYTGASGLNNCIIRNSDSSGTYSLLSPVFNTVNYINLSISFASRVSNNFPASGSTVPALEYTINGGQNWLNIPYIENNANSTWAPVNGGFRIDLPPTAEGQPALQFRWRVNIVHNSQGTYRIDDFDFRGTNTSGIQELIYGSSLMVHPNPSNGSFIISSNRFSNSTVVQITDLSGKVVRSFDNVSQMPFHVDSDLEKGIYLVRMPVNDEEWISKKIIIH